MRRLALAEAREVRDKVARILAVLDGDGTPTPGEATQLVADAAQLARRVAELEALTRIGCLIAEEE